MVSSIDYIEYTLYPIMHIWLLFIVTPTTRNVVIDVRNYITNVEYILHLLFI